MQMLMVLMLCAVYSLDYVHYTVNKTLLRIQNINSQSDS